MSDQFPPEQEPMSDQFPPEHDRRSTILAVCLWTVVYIGGTWVLLLLFGLLDDFKDRQHRGWLTFYVYSCFYWGAWTTYYRSIDYKHYKQGRSWWRPWTLVEVYSLRRVLSDEIRPINDPQARKEVAQPEEAKAPELPEVIKLWKEKARASITATTVLATISFIALTTFSGKMDLAQCTPKNLCSLSVTLGLLFALLAFVSFVITVDALDSGLNDFRRENIARVQNITQYFYERARVPRYVGMAAMLFCAVLLTALHDRWLASTMIGIIFLVGGRYGLHPVWMTRG
jgi:hypothetical protein